MMLREERSHLKITFLKRQPVYYVTTTLKVAKGSSVDNLLLEVRCPAICFKTLLLIQAVISSDCSGTHRRILKCRFLIYRVPTLLTY